MTFTLPFFTALIAGFIGALAGIGGGLIIVPALTLAGIPIKNAIAVSMLAVIATSSGAAATYVRDRITNLKLGMFLELFTMLGALLGAAVTVRSAPHWLSFGFGGVLLATAAMMVLHRTRERALPQDGLSRWLELSGSYNDQASGETVRYQATHAAWGAVCMTGAGFMAGLFGIGGGALKVLIYDLLMGVPPKVSTTTSNLIIGVTALAGTSVYLAHGLIDPALAVPIVLGILPGAFLGTRVLVRMRNNAVRGFFLVVLAIMGIEMIVRGIQGI